MKISSLKFVQVRYLYSLRRVAIAEKELRPDAQSCGLRSNVFSATQATDPATIICLQLS